MVAKRHPNPGPGALRVALPLFAHAMRQAALQSQNLPQPTSRPRTVSTGLASLDALLGGGFALGRTTLIAARPGIGASSLLLGATLAAAKHDIPVAYFSEHRTESQLRGRLVVLDAHVNSYRFRAGVIDPSDRLALAQSRERIPWHCLSFVAHKRITLAEIDRHLFSYHPLLVIADVRPRPPDATPPYDRFANLLKGALHLGQIARHHNAAVVLRYILPKSPEPPILAELPGLGALASSFNTVMMLHREQLEPHYEAVTEPGSNPEPGLAHLELVRHDGRDIGSHRVDLRFDHRFAGLSDIPPEPSHH